MPGPRIALTMGDPAGIGPEIILKAVTELSPRIERGELELLVIGCAKTYQSTASALGLSVGGMVFLSAESGAGCAPLGFIDAGPPSHDIVPGVISAAAGDLAYRAIERAVRLVQTHRADAVCTAPLNKEALNLAGHSFSGHTELLAHLTEAPDSVMMLVHGDMRVSHVSTHTALSEVAARVTPGRIRRVVALTVEVLQRLGMQAPRIGVAALNPHAGEGGLFGREDVEVIAPTLDELRADAYDVRGPLPGDTIFVKLRAGEFDAVVAMYHDQGHIPVKLLGFQVDPATGKWVALSGVNVTLGLPFVRTSVDHGTAFDIAGKGIANASSLIEAIDFAVQLSSRVRSAS